MYGKFLVMFISTIGVCSSADFIDRIPENSRSPRSMVQIQIEQLEPTITIGGKNYRLVQSERLKNALSTFKGDSSYQELIQNYNNAVRKILSFTAIESETTVGLRLVLRGDKKVIIEPFAGSNAK